VPILTNAEQVRALLKKMQSAKIAVPCFCSENTYTTEGILTGATKVAESLGLDSVPVYIAVTANYSGRQQLKNYTSLDSIEEGFLAFRSDLERLARDDGPFPKVLVLPNLDHGQPDSDDFLFTGGKGFWACVMYDCSKLPLEENRNRTAEFVKKYRKDYVIEGCVDEIYDRGQGPAGPMRLTQPEQAELFFRETNVDLIVANLGTEHRATKADLKYHSDLARKITSIVGPRVVLHGTSSLSKNDLTSLRRDGIAKVNIWTILETDLAQKMLQFQIKDIGKVLSKEQIQSLVEQGWLGKKALEHSKANNPSLGYMTEVYRRGKIKVPVVAELVEEYFMVFGYGDLKSPA